MKNNKLLLLLLMLYGMSLQSQVAIEKTFLDGSSILDFNTGTTKGIILPAVSIVPPTPTNGLLGFYTGDNRVYMYQNNVFVPLTEGNGSSAQITANGSAEQGTGVIIGATTSSATGVLVLESSTLALTLPQVNQPHLNVKSPYPGMICYDTASKSLAVFDGLYWNYWK